MRRLVLILALLLATPAYAEIAFDSDDEGTGTTTFSWTHTPVGTPRAVVVFIDENAGTTDVISGVTYGGDAMTRCPPTGRAVDTTGEPGSCYCYFLGTSIPTGPQSVQVTVSSGTTSKHAVSIAFTAASDTQTAGDGSCLVQGDVDDPSCTISNITGAVMTAAGLFSGLNDEANITAGANMTIRLGHDYGTKASNTESRTSQGSGNQTVAFTTTASDDVAMVAVAFEQTTPDPEPIGGPKRVYVTSLSHIERFKTCCID